MVTLCILDGFGYRKEREGNPVLLQGTPYLDKLSGYPQTLIDASEEPVGLVKGQVGNSEVGHMTIGAGRIIEQGLYMINKAIKDKSFFENKAFLKVMNHVKKHGSKLHIMGILSDGGVHSHIDHFKALIKMAHDNGVKNVYIHVATDGRDKPIDSAPIYLEQLLKAARGKAKIADIIGRGWMLDREFRYDRVKVAYDLMTEGVADLECSDPIEGVKKMYEKGIYDEFMRPILVDKNGRITSGDGVILVDYRTDREREITEAFTQDGFTGFERKKLRNLCYVGMIEYSPDFKGVGVAFKTEKPAVNLSSVLSKEHIKHYHVTETTKSAHVTYYFNGGRNEPYEGEDRKIFETINAESFAAFPEMRAADITADAIKAIKSKKYGFVLINLSNPDMVGHTGNLEAAKVAVKTVDKCAYDIAMATLSVGGDCIITADHGNVEVMIDKDGRPHNAHTTSPVKLWLVSDKHKDAKLIKGGNLTNIAATVTKLLGIKAPRSFEKPLF